MKKKSFDQRTLNSYFNLVYVKKYAPEVKHINLKLDKNNYVSGSLKVILTGKKFEKVPSFLRKVDIQFSGKVECQNYRMRYSFDESLFCEGNHLRRSGHDLPFGAIAIIKHEGASA